MPASTMSAYCPRLASAIVTWAMTALIRPLQLDDLEDLSRFLTAGFHAPPDADFALPEVLRWKYLGPWDDPLDQGPRAFWHVMRQAR